jgi:hypothetical protein
LGDITLRFISRYARFADYDAPDTDVSPAAGYIPDKLRTFPSKMNDMEDDESPF